MVKCEISGLPPKTPLNLSDIMHRNKPMPYIIEFVKLFGIASFIIFLILYFDNTKINIPEIKLIVNPCGHGMPKFPVTPSRKEVLVALVGPIIIGRLVLIPMYKQEIAIVIQVAMNTSFAGIPAFDNIKGLIIAM